MIVVQITMLPLGDPNSAYDLATMTIANDGTGTVERGNYTYTLSKQGAPLTLWKRGRITGFPREKRNVHYLIRAILEDALSK